MVKASVSDEIPLRKLKKLSNEFSTVLPFTQA